MRTYAQCIEKIAQQELDAWLGGSSVGWFASNNTAPQVGLLSYQYDKPMEAIFEEVQGVYDRLWAEYRVKMGWDSK